MTRATNVATVCCWLLAAGCNTAATAEILWLSETAPRQPKAARAAESIHAGHDHQAMPASAPAPTDAGKKHDHATEINLDGASTASDHRPGKRVWLRQGDDVKKARYVAATSPAAMLTMIDLAGATQVFPATTQRGQTTLQAELPAVGFYATYLEQRTVRNGQLQVQLPKIELLWASCVAKEVDEAAVAKPIINANAPLELVREHGADEGCMSRLVSGDAVNFRVLSFGQPVAGVPVTMITQGGWRNTRTSDDAGRVSFTLIREYYPKWFEFKKYHTDTFLAVTELERAETGELNGQQYTSARYVATLPGKYRPSPYDYRSYAWGLGIAAFVIVFGGLAIYLYRRRRLKPYREERLDDKA